MKTKSDVAALMEKVYGEIQFLREAGQKEYAHREENALANFERLSERMHISREQILLVYMEKHLDGIHSWVNGHRSQRESVRGRINDVMVYLILLRAMVEDVGGEQQQDDKQQRQQPPLGAASVVAGQTVELPANERSTCRAAFQPTDGELKRCKYWDGHEGKHSYEPMVPGNG